MVKKRYSVNMLVPHFAIFSLSNSNKQQQTIVYFFFLSLSWRDLDHRVFGSRLH